MTGRALYDALTDAWAQESHYARERAAWFQSPPPAWAFLASAERSAMNTAARRLTPKPRRKPAV